ncbi:MAG: hypothetical protein ACD_77C00156G0008 [uncultured bacterium]|nr:MAG: hypothetical protein ACD_77C00156G0008 [uncultured bacterium]
MIGSIVIKTNRLHLRLIGIDDANAVFKYRSDSDTNKYQGWIPKTIDDVQKFIGKISPTINIPGTWFQFVILLNESNYVIGDIGIHFSETDNNQVEIGFTLDKSFQGKGYAIETLKQVITFLFNDLNKDKITASIDPRNIKSINLVEKAGFKKEALFEIGIMINGELTDDLVYALKR